MASTKITQLAGRRVWDLAARLTGVRQRSCSPPVVHWSAIAPAGASRGMHEAIDLRDGGDDLGGFGVETALDNLADRIAPRLNGMEATDQEDIDLAMIDLDDTDTKSKLGGNTMIAVSAVLHAAAAAHRLPLWRYLAGDAEVRIPMPEIQILGGGAHAGGRVDIQDFMAIPIGAESRTKQCPRVSLCSYPFRQVCRCRSGNW